MTRHGREKGDYHVPRDVPPPESLVNRVWPFLDDLREMQKDKFSQWRQETIGLLEVLAKVLLQDVAVMYDEMESVVKSVEPFTLPDFFEYRRLVLEAVENDNALDPSTFKSNATELREMRAELQEKLKTTDEWQKGAGETISRLDERMGRMEAKLDHVLGLAGAALPVDAMRRAPAAETEVDGRSVAPAAVMGAQARGGGSGGSSAERDASVGRAARQEEQRQQGGMRNTTRRLQSPWDTSTWRPQELDMPAFASSFKMLTPTTVDAFVEEYVRGSRGTPPLRLVEKFFGPERRGRLPSWRSKHTRGGRKWDTMFCKRKVLYDLDAGKSAEDLMQIVRDENPEFFEKPKNLENGKIIAWLIIHLRQNKSGYESRRENALKQHRSRKRNKELREQAQAEQEVDGEEGSDEQITADGAVEAV